MDQTEDSFETNRENLAVEAINDEIRHIIDWAKGNQRDSRRDIIGYWALKVPSFLGAASATVLHLAKLDDVAAILSAISAFCISVDSVRPRGRLFNAHKRASNELFALQDWTTTKLNQIRATKSDEHRREAFSKLFDEIIARKAKISEAIAAAEANLTEPGSSGFSN